MLKIDGLTTSDGTKVLTVEQYDTFLKCVPEWAKPIYEVNTITGLRYVELQRLHNNPRWYMRDRNQILLPSQAQKKVKQKIKQRTIDRLPSTFGYIFKEFSEGKKPPERTSWNRNLERWGKSAGIENIGVKTPRKTIESWMLVAGIPEIFVYSRQGHDIKTSLMHYQSLSFTDYETRDIKKRLTEWGVLNAG